MRFVLALMPLVMLCSNAYTPLALAALEEETQESVSGYVSPYDREVYAKAYSQGSYVSSYTTLYTTGYTGAYTSSYTRSYTSGYTGSYTSSYTSSYGGYISDDYVGSYTGGYTGSYSSLSNSFFSEAAYGYTPTLESLEKNPYTPGSVYTPSSSGGGGSYTPGTTQLGTDSNGNWTDGGTGNLESLASGNSGGGSRIDQLLYTSDFVTGGASSCGTLCTAAKQAGTVVRDTASAVLDAAMSTLGFKSPYTQTYTSLPGVVQVPPPAGFEGTKLPPSNLPSTQKYQETVPDFVYEQYATQRATEGGGYGVPADEQALYDRAKLAGFDTDSPAVRAALKTAWEQNGKNAQGTVAQFAAIGNETGANVNTAIKSNIALFNRTTFGTDGCLTRECDAAERLAALGVSQDTVRTEMEAINAREQKIAEQTQTSGGGSQLPSRYFPQEEEEERIRVASLGNTDDLMDTPVPAPTDDRAALEARKDADLAPDAVYTTASDEQAQAAKARAEADVAAAQKKLDQADDGFFCFTGLCNGDIEAAKKELEQKQATLQNWEKRVANQTDTDTELITRSVQTVPIDPTTGQPKNYDDVGSGAKYSEVLELRGYRECGLADIGCHIENTDRTGEINRAKRDETIAAAGGNPDGILENIGYQLGWMGLNESTECNYNLGCEIGKAVYAINDSSRENREAREAREAAQATTPAVTTSQNPLAPSQGGSWGSAPLPASSQPLTKEQIAQYTDLSRGKQIAQFADRDAAQVALTYLGRECTDCYDDLTVKPKAIGGGFVEYEVVYKNYTGADGKVVDIPVLEMKDEDFKKAFNITKEQVVDFKEQARTTVIEDFVPTAQPVKPAAPATPPVVAAPAEPTTPLTPEELEKKRAQEMVALQQQYSAMRRAAAEESYALAQKEAELLKKNCPDCTDVAVTAVPGVQGYYSPTVKIPGDPVLKKTASGELLSDQEAAVRASGVDRSCASCVAAVVAMYNGMAEAGKKGDATVDTQNERVEEIRKLFNENIVDEKTGEVTLEGGLNNLPYGIQISKVLDNLANNKGYGQVEKAILESVCKTDSNVCSGDALASRIQTQQNAIAQGQQYTVPGESKQVTLYTLNEQEKLRVLGVTKEAYTQERTQIASTAFAEYNQKYPPSVASTQSASQGVSQSIKDVTTEGGLNKLMTDYNPYIGYANRALDNAKEQLDAAREAARGSAPYSEAMFAYADAIERYNDALESVETAKKAGAEGNMNALKASALLAEKKANEAALVSDLVGTLKRDSHSGLEQVQLPSGPVAPVNGGLLLGNSNDYEVRYRYRADGSTYQSFHYGQDWAPENFRDPEDRKVVSTTEGKVAAINLDSDGYGKFVSVEVYENGQPTGKYLRYAHITPNADLKVGDTVARGQEIALISGAGTAFGDEVTEAMNVLKMDEDAAYNYVVSRYTTVDGKWAGGGPTYPHLHLEYTNVPTGSGNKTTTSNPDALYIAAEGKVYERGEAFDPSQAGGIVTRPNINFDEYVEQKLTEEPPVRESSIVQKGLELGYSVLSTVKQVLYPTQPKPEETVDTQIAEGGSATNGGDQGGQGQTPSLTDTASCVGGNLMSFNFSGAAGCLGGGGGSNNRPNNSGGSSSGGSGGSRDEKPIEEPTTPAVIDLTVTASDATPSSNSAYRFRGMLTRIPPADEGVSLTDLQANYSTIINNRLSIDFQCNGSIDTTKEFTLPYRSFSFTQSGESSLTISEYLDVPVSGSHCFFFEGDITNTIQELNEGNNRSTSKSFIAE